MIAYTHISPHVFSLLDSPQLMQLAGAVFTESGVLQKFEIPSETFASFISAVGSRYKANPYHNWSHGVHVLLSDSWASIGGRPVEEAAIGQGGGRA